MPKNELNDSSIIKKTLVKNRFFLSVELLTVNVLDFLDTVSLFVKNGGVVSFPRGIWEVLFNNTLSQQVKACRCLCLMGALGLMGWSKERSALQPFTALPADHSG